MSGPALAVIGGSGLYAMSDLLDVERVSLDTPFGEPSDQLTIGTLDGQRVVFLPRHGRYHQFNPTRVPVRANIWALRAIGVRRVLSVSAVGSLRETIHPLDLVVPDQIVDRTTDRPRTFFDDVTVHVSLAEPYCAVLRGAVMRAAHESSDQVHDGGAYICIEGPQFSTKAESRIFRSWDLDIIGMTAMPEARLAREAGLCYATLAMVTDYDVWHETEQPVTVETVVDNLRQNVAVAQTAVRRLVAALSELAECTCADALRHAAITAPAGISTSMSELLAFLRCSAP